MKKLLILALSLSAANLFAQKVDESTVPGAVKATFKSMYPNAKASKWEKEDGNYEAEFEVNKVSTSSLFDAKGNFLETESEISIADLPVSISAYVSKNYAGEKIKEASKIKNAKGIASYEAEVKSGDLIFDEQGKFLKKKVEKAEDEDDDVKKK